MNKRHFSHRRYVEFVAAQEYVAVPSTGH